MNFPKTTNPIYTEFFSKSNLEADVEKTIWRGRPSENSFCFISPEVKYKEQKDLVLNKLRDVFDIKSDSFKEKFEMAISGDGQEVKRISTLHSSSLAALLLLYSVSEDNKLKCTLDGKPYTFFDSFFEVKTNVIDSHPSNMDVVLVGKNSEGKDVIFFLESKFSEYLNSGMCNNISIAYRNIYKELGLTKEDKPIPGILFEIGKGKENEDCLQIKSTDSRTPHYCSGIKQMISHYIGVSNFINKGKDAMDANQIPKMKTIVDLRDSADIILGEVLFAFDDKIDKGKTKFHSYSSIYSDLAKVLNKKSSKLFVLPKVLTYQDLLKDFKIDSKVKDFYQL